MKRSKLLWLLIAWAVLLGMPSCKVEDEGEEGGAIVEGTMLVGWNNPKGKIRVPDGVTDIAEEALASRSNITSVVIPSSVVSINKYAFYKCTGLRSVEINGSGLEIIGQGAFDSCTGLTSINIPESVTSIGNNAFGACSSLATANIPNSVLTLGERAFSGCTALRSLTIGNNLSTLEARTFQKCTSLTRVTIPDSVMTIHGTVFLGCDKLTSVQVSGNWQKNRSLVVGALTIDMLKDDDFYPATYWRVTE